MQHRRGNRYSQNYDLRRAAWERLGASGIASPAIRKGMTTAYGAYVRRN